jgi:Flp pilus assembly pilin Flp
LRPPPRPAAASARSTQDARIVAVTYRLREFLLDARGSTPIEYGVIAATMIIAIYAGAKAIGTKVLRFFVPIAEHM